MSRSRSELEKLIEKVCTVGTRVTTDGSTGYDELQSKGFVRYKVCHPE